jgi:hypothetical protein
MSADFQQILNHLWQATIFAAPAGFVGVLLLPEGITVRMTP